MEQYPRWYGSHCNSSSGLTRGAVAAKALKKMPVFPMAYVFEIGGSARF